MCSCLTNQTVSRSVGTTLGPTSCSLQQRPSLTAMIFSVFTFFGSGVIMSSWSWTKASLSAWQRFLRRCVALVTVLVVVVVEIVVVVIVVLLPVFELIAAPGLGPRPPCPPGSASSEGAWPW